MTTAEDKDNFKGSETDRNVKVLAIGGGKGGVGKTVIAASLGVGLAMLKKRVVVVDADLGGADLHTVMGIEKPNKTYYNFYNREFTRLDEILLEHPRFENLKVICGANGSLGIANLLSSQKMKFIRHIKKINADFVILDLGAGSHYNVLDFFLAADHGIVVVNPDPLSILESYNFIKLALFRQIAQTIRSHNGALTLIKEIARTETHRSQSTVHDLLREVQGMDVTLGEKMTAFLTEFRPMIMINMLAGTNDENNVLAIKRAAEELLAIDMEYIGAVQKDDTVRKSLDKMIPFISYDPKSPASRDLANIIIMKLLHSGRFKSLRNKHTLRRRVNEKGEEKRIEVICSVNCPYWEDCGFKNGGYPCELKFLSGIQGLRGE